MFEHIYIEEKALGYKKTEELISRFSGSQIIKIKHYKDIFDRRGQDFLKQKKSPSLIIAVNDGELVFEGARTCQDFGSEAFYYTSQIKNCIYDCEYCYLQGMYPSGNIVIFVNQDDYYQEIKRLSENRNISLSISYDTDLIALEGITGFVKDWISFAKENPNVLIEIRTKCGSLALFEVDIPENIIFAYTISPDLVSKKYEHNASGFTARKKAVETALAKGIKTRLCFDPVIPVDDFEMVYGEMIDEILSIRGIENVCDVSVGSFRISKEFIKNMQGVRLSALTTYPYVLRDGICVFDEEKLEKMTGFIIKKLEKVFDREKIFVL